MVFVSGVLIRKLLRRNLSLVWCPIHYKYLNGRNAKISHAHTSKNWDGCDWMRTYLVKQKGD